jgi:hypothetical protein
MISFVIMLNIFIYINACKIIPPSCNSCKHFVPNIKGNDFDNYGLCKIFKNVFYCNGDKLTIYDFAMHCRNNENQCGKNGYLYQHFSEKNIIDYDNTGEEIKNLINQYNNINNDLSGEIIEKYEIEELEKELLSIFQKLRKFNKNQLEKFGKSFYKNYKNFFN